MAPMKIGKQQKAIHALCHALKLIHINSCKYIHTTHENKEGEREGGQIVICF